MMNSVGVWAGWGWGGSGRGSGGSDVVVTSVITPMLTQQLGHLSAGFAPCAAAAATPQPFVGGQPACVCVSVCSHILGQLPDELHVPRVTFLCSLSGPQRH